MEIHGFDDPTSDVHSMYAPDDHGAAVDTGADGLGHDTGYDPDDSAPGPETVELDVDGHSTDVTATVDTDHDGRADTAVIESGDGNRVAVTDSDGDGTVDHALLIDSEGKVVDRAVYDESTGQWHDPGEGDTSSPPAGSSTDASDSSGPSDSSGGDPTGTVSSEQIEFDADGRSAVLEATVDTDHDGRGDTAVVDAGGGERIAVTDTDHDGRADEAALLDSSGQVLDTAHIDPATGEWVQGSDGHTPYDVGEEFPGADGATTTAGTGGGDTATDTSTTTDTGTTTGTTGTDAGDTSTTTAAGSSGPSQGEDRQITVEAAGRSSEVQATLDTNHDGLNDTAVVQGPDGSQIALTDTDGDGEADRAALFDAQGNLVSTAHFDPATGDWADDPR